MRIVLDLGTSCVWTRPPVGIVRTEQRFARYLLESSSVPVAFCRFDKALGCHVEIPRERARALVTPLREEPAPDAPEAKDESPVVSHGASPSGASRPPMRDRMVSALKQGGRAILRRVPEPLRPEAKETLKAGYHFARGSARLAAHWSRRMRRRAAGAPGSLGRMAAAALPPARAFEFLASDIYVSMGLDWEYNDVRNVYRERRRVGFKTILFCYDTIPVRFPHLMSFDARQVFARYFVDVGHAADRIIAISETSKRDFLALMAETDAPQPPVDVVVLGTDLGVAESSMRPPSEDLVDVAFVLCVSTIEARKNHETLYNAWDRLAEKHGEEVPLLVIVGMVGWGVGDLLFRMRTNPRVKDRIRILDNLADSELAWLYRNSLFTVFPSLYEGWGLPVVESLANGKPCICSTAPAVAEAAQGLATTLDPLDTPAWVDAIESLWRDRDAREAAAARCAREFRPQLWQDHARQLLAIAVSEARP